MSFYTELQFLVAQPDNQSVLLVNNIKEPSVTTEVNVPDGNLNVNDSENTVEDPYINATTYDVLTANVTRIPVVPPSDALVLRRIIEDLNEHRLSSTKVKKGNTVSDEDRGGRIKIIKNELITSYDKRFFLPGPNIGS